MNTFVISEYSDTILQHAVAKPSLKMVILREWGVSLTARETDCVCCPTVTTSLHMQSTALKRCPADGRTFYASAPGHRQQPGFATHSETNKLYKCNTQPFPRHYIKSHERNISIFWDKTLRQWVTTNRRFGSTQCPHHQGSIRATPTNTFTINHFQSQRNELV